MDYEENDAKSISVPATLNNTQCSDSDQVSSGASKKIQIYEKLTPQYQINFPPGQSLTPKSNDNNLKTAENVYIPNNDVSPSVSSRTSLKDEDCTESESSALGFQKMHISSSASPFRTGTPQTNSSLSSNQRGLSPSLTSTPANDEYSASHLDENNIDHQKSDLNFKLETSCNQNAEVNNSSPIYGTSTSLVENRESKISFNRSYSPNSRFVPQVSSHHISGESSDEKGDRPRTEKLQISSSREGSFERSVSFQEGILDGQHYMEKNESHRSADSPRSLDTSRVPDFNQASLTTISNGKDRERKETREGKSGDKDKKSRGKTWYSVLNPTYKSRSEDLKRLFKELPLDERLIVDYSCALQKDILVHGRLYVTSNYFCFYSKIFGWETFLCIKCSDIVAITKEKTALVIPNALQINTENDKNFFTSFAARDKTYLMLFRIWQNALIGQQVSPAELWQWVHSSYGDELGLTSDDDDYVAPSTEDDTRSTSCGGASCELQNDSIEDKLSKTLSLDSAEDISQTESNQEDSGIPLSSFIVDSKEESSRNQKSTSRSSSPPTYPHTPSVGGISHDPISIPTDLSDSNDSDTQKEKLLGPITDTVVCPNIVSHHQGREMINAVYALPIDVVFTLLFTNSKFMLDLHVARKTYDVVASAWQSNPETNQKIRQVTYTVTLPTNSFGPKVSHVTETQVISSFSKSCEIYTVDAEACNGGIPYADCFYISNHWCLTREAGNETRLAVWSEVKYKKSVWGFMRSVIDKNAFNGLKSLMIDLNDALLLEVDRTNQKRTRRRRRRCGSKGSDHLDPLMQVAPGDKVKDLSSSSQIPFRKLTLPSILLEPESPPLKMTVLTVALLFLCVLLAVNSFLYYRLYALEDRVVNGVSSKHLNFGTPIFKRGDDAPIEEWVHILHEQEEFHSAEVERWRTAVSNAADYLRKAEESLRSLHESIPQKQASKIQSLLRRLQILQQVQGKKPPSSSSSSLHELEEKKINEQLYSKPETEF